MKKIKYLLLIIPFLFISSVKANTDLTLYDREDLSYFHSIFTDEEMISDINYLINEYKTNYKEDYPYYLITLSAYKYDGNQFTTTTLRYGLIFYKNKPTLSSSKAHSVGSTLASIDIKFVDSSIDSTINNYIYVDYYSDYSGIVSSEQKDTLVRSVGIRSGNYTPISLDFLSGYSNKYVFNALYYSNFDLVIDSLESFFNESVYGQTDKDFNLLIPTREDKTQYYVLSTSSQDVNYVLEKSSDYDNLDIEYVSNNLVEVNLNDYPYIALSLKDYSKTDSFDVTNYVKGQYCLTPVYDYGLKERKEVLSGTQVERCSPYYTDYTLVRTTILDSDLKNHAIYYLKAYDTSKENKVKIDTSVFNIHYITEEDKDNPILNINGTKYSVIPFDSLTDTANKSEAEGYVSGAVKEFNFSDIFSAPLDFMKGIWSSITQIFVVITEFISLLPQPLQYFFYISFMLAIILGLIKILL